MISKNSILRNIQELERLYNQAGKGNPLFYSKLAILELCGWIEESMDHITRKCLSRKLRKKEDREFIEKHIIKPISSFEYHRFRLMLSHSVGFAKVIKIERSINNSIFLDFKSTLESLKKSRDCEAHTHIHGTLKYIDAPSVTKNNLNKIFLGLKRIEELINR